MAPLGSLSRPSVVMSSLRSVAAASMIDLSSIVLMSMLLAIPIDHALSS